MSKFEIFVGSDDKFYFHLKADNGEIIAASQGYTSKQSAELGIDAIRRIAAQAAVLDLTQEQTQILSTGETS
ncbi:MAG: YegP family protein [Candidatus Obscuribacter sp.]|nr:YegP family protein [Candidatus Obscuribacter sp.]MBP6348844.1 YegP family protein [Candidatus Obscuribacter sp.]MBP6592554.1 YegP family protein [Candidatus Obscuribacter sp.]MBP7576027.1 YegP family protein [Candidatus Obscuribacter sp.]